MSTSSRKIVCEAPDDMGSLMRRRTFVVSSIALLILLFVTYTQKLGLISITSLPSVSNPISPSSKLHITGKPKSVKITEFVFYVRRDRAESMDCYVELPIPLSIPTVRIVYQHTQRNLVTNGGWLDDVIWVVNTGNPDDLSLLDEILARSPL